MNNLKYTIELNAKGKLIPELKIVKQQMDRVTGSVKSATGKFREMGSAFSRLSSVNLVSITSNLKGMFEAINGISNASLGMGFQQAMADLKAITGIAGKDFDTLADSARKVGRETGLGAQGAVEAYTLLASQIQIDKIGLKGLMTLQKETITLAQAGGMSMSDAATAMAATINQFGLEATEANRVINVLAAGSKYGAAEVTDLAQSFKVAGATAAAAGLSVEDTAGALEVLSQMNLKGSEAGTALRNIILQLQTTLGIDLSKNSLADALDGLKPKLQDVTYLSKVFGTGNIAAAQYLITNAEAVREMTDAVTGTGTAQEQAAIRTDTMGERMKVIQAHIDDMKIGLFDATGGLTGYASALGDTAVMCSQLLPLGDALKGLIGHVAGLSVVVGTQLVTAVKGAAAAFPGFVMNLQFMSGVVLSKMATGFRALAGALSLQNIAAKAAAAGTAVLNAVMSANPVALVVLAIAALVAGLVYAYKHSDRFREVVDKLWEGFKKVVAVVWDYVVKAFEGLSKAVQKVWNAIKKFLGIGKDAADQAEQVAESTEKMADANNKAARSATNLNNALLEQGKSLSTIAGLEERISELKTKQKDSSLQNAIAIEKEVRAYEDRLEAIKRQIAIGASDMQHLAEGKYGKLTAPDMQGVDPVKGVKIPVQFDEAALARSWRQCQLQFSDSIKEIELTGEKIGSIVTGAIQQFAAGFGEALASGNALEIFKTLLMSLMDMLQQFGSALIALGTATLAFKSIFANPIAGLIAGAAMVTAAAAAKAALQNATAFANGGIVSGPTYALVGEYAGAKNNPEVIAPLNKLRSLIEPARTGTEGLRLETKIKGKDLYVALRSVEHEINRTR